MANIFGSIAGTTIGAAFIGGYFVYLGVKSAAQAAQYTYKIASVNAKNMFDTAIEKGKVDPEILRKISIIASENDINNWINLNLGIKSTHIENISSEELYDSWAKLLNENILFNYYGRLLIIDHVKKKIDDGYGNLTDDERKLNTIAFLWAQLRSAKDEAQFNKANLFAYWNREDQNWLNKIVFPLAERPQQITQLLGKALSYNNPYNNLITNISEIIQIASVIKEVLKIDLSSSLTVVTDLIDPGIINPIILLNKADKLMSNIIPGYYSGRDKNRALDIFNECMERYIFLISLIANDLKDTKENNKITLDSIIRRDYNYLGHKKFESLDLRKALLERILKIEALKYNTKIDYTFYKDIFYNDILNMISSF